MKFSITHDNSLKKKDNHEMQERIRIRFTRAGVPLQISHLGDDGIVFAFESSAKPLGFAIRPDPRK